jgi:hypothetical protein
MAYCGGGKLTRCHWQIGTTKGTGGDVLVLEEAAYCDEGFFYGVSSCCVARAGTQRRVRAGRMPRPS